MNSIDTIRLGCGAGFSSDRLGPAVDLAQRGALDYLVFECLGERTMAFGHRDRMLDHDIAHARAGDRGNTSNVSVCVYDPKDYPLLKQQLTADRITKAFPKLFSGPVTRYEMDDLHGLNFVLLDALEGGVNTSLNLDSHGKSFSYLILGLPIQA